MDRRKFIETGAALAIALVATPGLGQPMRKSRVFVTGSADGLGKGAAGELMAQGHDVVVHVRSQARMSAVKDLVDRGAKATIGDLSDPEQVRDLARQVNALGRMDAVIHNAGVNTGDKIIMVNTVAPYLLTALIRRPKRLVYISSTMHRGGRADLAGIDFTGRTSTGSYSDSKLFVSTLAAAVARRWPDVLSNSVTPGWVPTRMGGSSAPDDLRLGHVTQVWLAVSDDAEARTSGGYWFHQKREKPHPAVNDVAFQDKLLAALAAATGTKLA